MNIEQIRAEIPEAFGSSIPAQCEWVRRHGEPDFDRLEHYLFEIDQITASILVDWAYEAGIKRGNEASASALNEVELRENPIYRKGYENGKADGFQDGYSECDAEIEFNWEDQYHLGYNDAAASPKAWYVTDKNGKEVHIGDYILNGNGEIEVVDTLGDGYVYIDDGCYYSSNIEKIDQDSWDKLHLDLYNAIHQGATADEQDYFAATDKVDDFIKRAKELAGVDDA